MTHSTFSVGITDPTVKNGNPLRAMPRYFTAAAIQCPLCANSGRRLNQEFSQRSQSRNSIWSKAWRGSLRNNTSRRPSVR